ncbi:hypothetical protein HELRODRAFT_179916 [Helobdella robusta]|uniref:Lymphocyte expansion molecule n=1 Tax=Helobdella robusta TaxID=6412 RepID=T1FF90_HELRO|nr:hypothetical protein HELRODRAFT_179916 [Helobdella robusta]ESN95053.1 hypothetical protein HELRODRAFT_179916 [Helobdella robusta]
MSESTNLGNNICKSFDLLKSYLGTGYYFNDSNKSKKTNICNINEWKRSSKKHKTLKEIKEKIDQMFNTKLPLKEGTSTELKKTNRPLPLSSDLHIASKKLGCQKADKKRCNQSRAPRFIFGDIDHLPGPGMYNNTYKCFGPKKSFRRNYQDFGIGWKINRFSLNSSGSGLAPGMYKEVETCKKSIAPWRDKQDYLASPAQFDVRTDTIKKLNKNRQRGLFQKSARFPLKEYLRNVIESPSYASRSANIPGPGSYNPIYPFKCQKRKQEGEDDEGMCVTISKLKPAFNSTTPRMFKFLECSTAKLSEPGPGRYTTDSMINERHQHTYYNVFKSKSERMTNDDFLSLGERFKATGAMNAPRCSRKERDVCMDHLFY